MHNLAYFKISRNSNSAFFCKILQDEVKKCIKMFEDATRLVSISGMFSTNESHEEISTSHLKYLLLPFFLAQTTLKLCNIQDRKNVVDVAKIYYEDYLKRCEEYGLCERSTTAVSKATDIIVRDEMQRLTQMAQQRNQKLQKYQQKKELKDQIKQLRVAMERDDTDEEIRRNFYLKLIKSCVWESQDELSTLEQEAEILDHIAKLKETDPDYNEKEKTKRVPSQHQPLKPIIITKDEIQKAVYGAGYPSLPTFTVQEFYDQRVAEGLFPHAAEGGGGAKITGRVEVDQEAEQAKEELENEIKEEQIENDDPEYLERARNMDEFKDDHRRGYGNRYNRS